MELDNEVYSALTRYFSALSHFGYKLQEEVNSLLVFCFIDNMLNSPLSQYITEEDYETIVKALNCLYGTCMIPYPDYKRSVDNIVEGNKDFYRISDKDILRITQVDNLRTASL